MLSLELILAVLLLLQPPIFGFLFFSVARSGLAARFLFSQLKTTRARYKSIKFFECAVYSRLINSIQYDIFVLSFCILFILYDVDLIFFFTEVTCFEFWTPAEALFVFLNLLLLFFGLWYDYLRLGFNWSH